MVYLHCACEKEKGMLQWMFDLKCLIMIRSVKTSD